MILVNTSLGSFTIELFEEQAPTNCQFFSKLVSDGFYNNTIIHQVIRDFTIQAGRYDSRLKKKTFNMRINGETSGKFPPSQGTVALARCLPSHSCNHEFFINTNDNGFLNNNRSCQFSVFGKIKKGMDVISNINQVSTTSNAIGLQVPVATINILSMENVLPG